MRSWYHKNIDRKDIVMGCNCGKKRRNSGPITSNPSTAPQPGVTTQSTTQPRMLGTTARY